MSEITAQIAKLDGMNLKELQAMYGELLGVATRVPNKKWLVTKIAEALEAKASTEEATASTVVDADSGAQSATAEEGAVVEQSLPELVTQTPKEIAVGEQSLTEPATPVTDEGAAGEKGLPQKVTPATEEATTVEAGDAKTTVEEGSGPDAEEGEAGVTTECDATNSTGEATIATEPPMPMVRDPRLPPPGTVLVKRNKAAEERCRCTVTAEGVEYAGKLYSSLSAAGSAAATDLGLKGAINGYIFWGLTKTAPAKRSAKAKTSGLQKLWDRYIEAAKAAVSKATDDTRAEVQAELEKHGKALAKLMDTVG